MQKALRLLSRHANLQTIQDLKDKYCPDGKTCEDIIGLGMLIFMFVFMYIAVAPIL